MAIDRRRVLKLSTIGAALPAAGIATTPARAVPLSTLGIDATQLGVRAGGADDQTRALQKAIDQTAGARVPLVLGPGLYRTGELRLPTGTQLFGIRGATRIAFTSGSALISSDGADFVTLAGLVLDGGPAKLPSGRGLVHLARGRGIRIAECEVMRSGHHGIALEAVEGSVTGNTVASAAATAIFSLDAKGLAITGNTVTGAGDNGIEVWRSDKGEDGTLVADNRIEDVANRSGGSGQYGNAVAVFRAGGVSVRGNRIRNCAFSAVRANSTANIEIVANNCANLGEVAIYAEFAFDGAVIASNLIDGAAHGISVTNFLDKGGRLAVVQGNLVRNLTPLRPIGTNPRDAGIGISVEGDAAITGNVVDNVPRMGILLGWGPSLRDAIATGNIVRNADVGIAISVAPGAGSALVADNLLSGIRRTPIVGMEWTKPVTGDLNAAGAARYAQLAISGNQVR